LDSHNLSDEVVSFARTISYYSLRAINAISMNLSRKDPLVEFIPTETCIAEELDYFKYLGLNLGPLPPCRTQATPGATSSAA
jgi:hypothetical protein